MILITGAAGFIGSVLVSELNKRGITELILVDHFRDGGKWLNLRGLKFADFISVEDFEAQDLWKTYTRLKAIYHMGACSATTEKNMDFLYKNNFQFSRKLFELAGYGNIPFIYASSAATYGEGELGYNDDHGTIPKLRPLNPYGYSKQLFDEWVLNYKNKPEVWYGLKFFNVFGPNEYHKGSMSSVVFKAFEQIQKEGSVQLFKSHRPDFVDGGQQRDFIYVMDVVRALLALADHGKNSGIYNMGTGVARSFQDLVTATFTAMKKPVKINYIDMPVEIRNQYQYFTQANMSKFSDLLPDFKFMSLEESVHHYVTEYLMKPIRYTDPN